MNDKTEQPTISMIAAIGKKDRTIGNGNKLLWHIPSDMKRFRDTTMGHPIIMGRKTYESLPDKYRPLPGRKNIIVTRQENYPAPQEVLITHSLEDALTKAKSLDSEEIFIGGGQQIYEQALPFIEKLYLTIVDTDKTGDTFFPEYKEQFTKETYHEEGESNGYHYVFQTLERTS